MSTPPPASSKDNQQQQYVQSGKGREALQEDTRAKKRTRRSGFELGLPAVSNPLRLLAEAVHDQQGEKTSSWLSYFSDGIFDSRPEVGRHLDPIATGLVTSDLARELHAYFMANLNPRVTLLDPEIYTFDHIGRHSALSSAIFFAAVRFESRWHRLSGPLETHLRQQVIPHVISNDCATIELVLAFLIYGTYYPVVPRVTDDRSWSVVCHATRMATELDFNSRVHSTSLNEETANKLEQRLIRHYRTRERTWLNLWLQEQSFSNKTGRLPFLATRGVVDQSRNWHKSAHAIEGDGIVVAHVQLRLLSMRCQELFERLRPTSDDDIEYYLERVEADIEAWSAQFRHVEPRAKRSTKLAIYKHHVKIMVYVVPLRSSSAAPLANSTITRLQDAVLAYLVELVTPALQEEARYSHNSLFTAAVYVAVLALKLVALSSKHAFIRVDALRKAVDETASVFRKVSHENGGTGCVAHRHAEYLEWLISKQRQMDQTKDNGSVATPSQSDLPTTELPLVDHFQQPEFDSLFADVDFASWVQRFISEDSSS